MPTWERQRERRRGEGTDRKRQEDVKEDEKKEREREYENLGDWSAWLRPKEMTWMIKLKDLLKPRANIQTPPIVIQRSCNKISLG